jgi:hypothetical protein
MYEVQRKEGWGNVIVAGRDLLPGAEVLQDRALLKLHREVDNTSMPGFEGLPVNLWLPEAVKAYYDFRSELSTEEQNQILALPVNTDCPFIRQHRQLFQDWTATNYLIAKLGIGVFEIDKLIQVLCVMRQRIFQERSASIWYVYGTASLLYPSCTPNCHLDMKEDRCVCRILVPVKAGDLLTVSMDEEWSTLSVAVRRRRLLDEMDFTCHCARCDSLGDDTRQFPCFNTRCSGYHWVCQPRELDEPEGQHYEGVEYVEPHLLPCTVCQRSPPLEYQAHMLQEEQKSRTYSAELEKFMDSGGQDLLKHLMLCMERPSFLMRTVEGMYQTQVELSLLNTMMKTPPGRPGSALLLLQLSAGPRLLKLAESLEASFDMLLRVPTAVAKYEVITHAIKAFLITLRPQRALVLARRLIRAHRIREGRLAPAPLVEPLLDCALAVCGGANTAPVGCCAYCEESPERAAMKRSRCGACMKVVYCGTACQKAHWKVHKALCKK